MSAHNIFPGTSTQSKRPETSQSDNNPSSIHSSTPLALTLTSKSSSFGFWQSAGKKSSKRPPIQLPRHYSSDNLQATTSKPENIQHIQHLRLNQPAVLKVDPKLEMEKVFHDLDEFIEKELNEIQVRKRIEQLGKAEKIKETEKESEDKFLATIRLLKDEVREIKENQKQFENKIKRHEEMQSNLLSQSRKRLEYDSSNFSSPSGSKKKEKTFKKLPTPSKVQYTSIEVHPQPPPLPQKPKEKGKVTVKALEVPLSCGTSSTSIISERSKSEKIARLESELFKAETLMMKINRVLENVTKVDDHNIDSIINIERHYLVATTRFDSALSELRRLNDDGNEEHPAPFNRKGKLVIRDVMLEVKLSYFQRKIQTKNEYLLAMIKYNDMVMASNAVRITNDIRIIKFPECFSIPEAYSDFEMRLEIFGTTFWRQKTNGRETMLKKYGFVTFTLADTGTKPKRFQMVEVLPADQVPIRSKILMRITQKITAGVQYRGLLYVKVRDVWHETNSHLNGHILEISFKSHGHTSLTQSRETIILDLYNFDSDAVIPVDTRVSKRPFSFSLKFNHYVDVANF